MSQPPTLARTTNKLADKLGINNRAELNALHQFVQNPEEDPESFLKAPATKINKLQAKLGEEEAAQYAIFGGAPDRNEAMKSLKLKKNAQQSKRLSLSQELLYDPPSPTSAAASSVDGTTNSPRSTLQQGEQTAGSSMSGGKRGGALESEQTPLQNHLGNADNSGSLASLLGLSSDDAAAKGSRKTARMGKLADFFGAQDDSVGTLRKMVSNTRETAAKRNSVPTFLLRMHFANQTHMIVANPIEATTTDIVAHTMRKLLIQEDTSLYGLFLMNSSANRMLTETERVFDAVRAFKENEYILFRRKGKADMQASSSTENAATVAAGSEAEMDPDLAELTGLIRTGGADGHQPANKQRKVAKLATFFGVSPENDDTINEGQAELEDLLNMVNESLNDGGDDGTTPNSVAGLHTPATTAAHNEAVLLKRHAMNETTIYKEGWLMADSPNNANTEVSAWVSLERGQLHVRYCESRESAISPRDPVQSTLLNQFVCEVPDPNAPTFLLRNQATGNAMFTFTASSCNDRDDWVSLIQKLADTANQNASKLSRIAMSGANTGTSASDAAPQRSMSTRSRAKSSRATIDDFEFHRVLGKGKYGKVLLCSHKVSKKVFAIKVIQKDAESEDTARTESEILRSIKHPFIVGLHFAFQNPERLYLVMEYVNGGELFFHLSQSGRFPEKRAKFYAAEIILALQCLHGKGVVYRDLKLENILLDKEGHIKIADFGLSRLYTKEDETRTFSMAGTLEYFAPEVIEGVNYSFPADWWAFGVILFELLCGYHPFYNPNPDILYQLILRAPLEFPSFTSGKAADLITRLLDRDYKRRLGSGKLGSREIQQHPFFKEVDWTKLFRKELPPPWRPDVADDFDVKFFDKEFTEEVIEDEDVKGH